MSKILLVTSSPRGDQSMSNKFAGELAAKIQAQTNGSITHLDVGQNPINHLDTTTISAIRSAPADRNGEEAEAIKYSDERVAELLAADTVIIGTGLINFSIYSGLKAWIDLIARAGQTFRYTETGPVGLATGKKVYIVLASSGIYSEGPAAPLELAVPYLKTVLGFMGMTNVEVIRVEGLAFGPEAAEKAIAAATAKIEDLAKAA
ncbi:FMN-dependent NADH-azoreductase [Rhizobium skierniewicense]|uniref:FMN-dependent NADH-azoreductase n=1 Tax=Rhizobium TaxID=379 RepID=UPI0017865EC2|nr:MULTISPECIES: FMN-dependent NADH-azoreductase [Rhizobium]MBD8687073.1 FMN-dependent NADH-azoreductase [Rhizobium sp. CFBP 13644]MBD8691124.1 FMN-dependent NADH-azoreductase [Rhizobium sp. CFBP 13717]MCI9865105.1 FMN-dependent NADH-azoreductase [Rhizobium skierniewicense]